MYVEAPDISINDGRLIYRVNIREYPGKKQLWFSIPAEFAHLVSDLSDAVLVALLLPAMKNAEPIHIEGRITQRLLRNMNGPVQRALSLLLPGLTPAAITADNISSTKFRADGVATGFSGGVDSYCLLGDFHYNNDSNDQRITHLLYNNVGSHGSGIKGRALFNSRYQQLKPFAERTGLPFVQIDSNVDEFYEGFDFENTHTLRNASVAFFLQKGIGHYLYASSFSYMHILPEHLTKISLHDYVLLPLLENDAMDIRTVGSEYTRLEKIKQITSIPDTYDALNVCVKESENCSVCRKCMLTQFALEMIGCLELYRKAFNLELYHKHRTRYLARLLLLDSYSGFELRTAARINGIKIPLTSRILSLFLRVRSAVFKSRDKR